MIFLVYCIASLFYGMSVLCTGPMWYISYCYGTI